MIVGLFAKYRYVPAGLFTFTKDYYEYNGTKKRWTEVRTMDIYYRGDLLWFSKFGFFQWYKARSRYSNLNYVAVKGYNEKLVDKIVIDEQPIYFKIRNKTEKDAFFKIKEFAETSNVRTTENKTDFSYTLFGRTFG